MEGGRPVTGQRHTALLASEPKWLPEGLVDAVQALEQEMGCPVWLLIQDGGDLGVIDGPVVDLFGLGKSLLSSDDPIGLLIHSPGGYAAAAYQIARLLQRRSSKYTAIVPRYAKSAATLLALGAKEIIMGEMAELGPIDAQFIDVDRERRASALEEVQSVERMTAAALGALDQTVLMLLGRTRQGPMTVLPIATEFVATLMRPLFESLDAVQYSQRSRMLKVAEEYAIRLLTDTTCGTDEAQEIASKLAENYPEHEFVIDAKEAKSIGLPIRTPTGNVAAALDQCVKVLDRVTALGPIVVPPQKDESDEEEADDAIQGDACSSGNGDQSVEEQPNDALGESAPPGPGSPVGATATGEPGDHQVND